MRYILPPSSGVRSEAPAAGAWTPKFGANHTENQTDDDGVAAGADAPASGETSPDGDDVDDATPAAAGSAEGEGSLPPLVDTGVDLAPPTVTPTSAGVAAVKVDDERGSVAADAAVGAESPAEAEVEEADDSASRRRLWR